MRARPATVPLILPVILYGLAVWGLGYFLEKERDWLDRFWIFFLECALFSGAVWLSARPLLSALLTLSPLALICGISHFKFSQMNLPAMLPDLKYLMGANLIELLQNHAPARLAALAVGACLCGLLAGGLVLYRSEPPAQWSRRRLRRLCLASGSLCLVLLAVQISLQNRSGGSATGSSRERRFLSTRSSLSTFVLSAFWKIRLQPVATTPLPAQALPAAAATTTNERHPNILVVLEESTFHLHSFLKPENQDFASTLLKPRGALSGVLHVHTFGGNTWLTEFAVLTGIPHVAFGSMGAYAIPILTGRIQTGFPEFLKRNGYATLAVIPTSEKFINIGRFYTAIGIDQVCSLSTNRQPGHGLWNVTDRFVFENVLQQLAPRLGESNHPPVFAWVLTIRQHGPHNPSPEAAPFLAAVKDGLPESARKELAEFLYRGEASARDLQYFREELARRFPGEPFVLAHFGDHQPAFTARLWPDPAAKYLTYLAVETFNWSPAETPALPATVDAAFLQQIITRVAGLKPDENLRSQAELAAQTAFQYDCQPDSEPVARYHRFLLDRRLVLDDR